MGYHLNAIIGNLNLLKAAASAMPPAVVVPLKGKLGLIPLSEELFDAINQNSAEKYEEAESQMFTYLSAKVASWLKSLSAGNVIAYVEAEYFGGAGDQCAVAWNDGVEVLPPTKGQNAINQALSSLGVQAENGKDEFDTVWLGRHRTMKGWCDEGTARQRTAEEIKAWTYPPFGQAVESLRRFLRDQDCSDNIRWIWREDTDYHNVHAGRRANCPDDLHSEDVNMDKDTARKMSFAYSYDPAFIPAQYGLAALTELVASAAVVGATRFLILPSFEPERLYTLTFRRTEVEFESAVGKTALWTSIPQFVVAKEDQMLVGEPFRVEEVERKRSVFALADLPPPLNSWQELKSVARQASECHSYTEDGKTYFTADGVTFHHDLHDRFEGCYAKWANPHPKHHAIQVRLIEAYITLIDRHHGTT